MPVARHGAVRTGWTLLSLFAATLALAAPRLAAQGLPDRLSDAEFWHIFTDFSEPGGYFQSDNLLSNETGFQSVIPELVHRVKPGGVYLGVGPEQNFTYIVALHPKMAFICDIRHRNADHHLIYKALIELSADRADFISRLFSRPRPAGLGVNTNIDSLFAAFANLPPDSMLFYKTLAAIKDRLVKFHGFALTPEDTLNILENFDAFYRAGPQLSYNFSASGGSYNGRGGGSGMPNYMTLMEATDLAGVQRSYLATDANYQVLRDLELRNMLVPVTGDFGVGKALRAVGDYVRQHGATITTFYTSNAEQYVFGSGNWFTFEAAVATFPLDSTSTFIRSGRAGGGGFGGGGRGGGMSTSLLQSMMELVKATADGRIQTYQDVLATSH
jgi:hypothetical protein